jgi:hypothetical protein
MLWWLTMVRLTGVLRTAEVVRRGKRGIFNERMGAPIP